MNRTILTFGLIAGVIIAAFMVYSIYTCYSSADFKDSELLGYTAMIVAFSFVFIGVKNFRDKKKQGVISFGEAFKIGILISLVASTIYVLVWLVDYYVFVPDFMDRYSEHVLKELASSNSTPDEIRSKTEELQTYKNLYKNPIWVIVLTYMEVLPIGCIVSLISAVILKRKSSL